MIGHIHNDNMHCSYMIKSQCQKRIFALNLKLILNSKLILRFRSDPGEPLR
jgi:hypothetical protein